MPGILTNSFSRSSRTIQRRSSLQQRRRSSTSSSTSGKRCDSSDCHYYKFNTSSSSSSPFTSTSHTRHPSFIDASSYSIYHHDFPSPVMNKARSRQHQPQQQLPRQCYFAIENKDQSRSEDWGHFVEV
ncbi:hypothetical protein IV203_018872 [Nitzschia inconspicua]|uniref:Uncharacterized protein n=1 Tax=Nitzschia inconspicua TaxID=303405 RepID=A0A9K3M2T8_9STRA|nr:hypothetical protein IV203_018872 [Nitzschia inconspicua]